MKEFKVILLTALVVVLGITAAQAINITVTATVPDDPPTMAVEIKELVGAGADPGTSGAPTTVMNFGNLVNVLTGGGSAGAWYSEKWYAVFMYTTSYGNQYQVTSSCAGLVGRTTGLSLPAGSFILKPDYNSADEWVWSGGSTPQGGQPGGSSLGTEGSAVGSDKLIYQSEAAASNRIIRAYYSLPNPTATPPSGFAAIPLSQAPDTYEGTVTITIASY